MRLIAVLLTAAGLAAAAGDYVKPLPFGKVWADMDTGVVKTSATALGGVGYTLNPDSGGQGSGFRFPKTLATSRLYYAGFMCGNDTAYLVDRCYGHPASRIGKEFGIAESLYRQNLYGGQEWSGAMDDSHHAHPKNLYIWLHTIELPGAYGNGAIFAYDFWNRGATALDSMYAGIWADFDLTTNGSKDLAATDAARRMSWIRQGASEIPCCGLALLAPHQASNVSVIFNPTWVYPTDTCVTKLQKLEWMDGRLHQDSATSDSDYSLLVATGPFDLAPGGRHVVAFALAADSSRARLNRKVDSLQAWYDLTVGAGERNPGFQVPAELRLAPNPVTGLGRITFGAATRSTASLNLYDRSGRLLGRVWSGRLDGSVRELAWNGARLKNGVYFLRLEGTGLSLTVKAVVAR